MLTNQYNESTDRIVEVFLLLVVYANIEHFSQRECRFWRPLYQLLRTVRQLTEVR